MKPREIVVLGEVLSGDTLKGHVMSQQGREELAYYKAARELAERLGEPVEDLLLRYSKAVEDADYPTAECLEPEEVELHVAGAGLGELRVKHITSCRHCGVLVSEARPDADRREELVEAVRAQRLRDESVQPQVALFVEIGEAALATAPRSDRDLQGVLRSTLVKSGGLAVHAVGDGLAARYLAVADAVDGAIQTRRLLTPLGIAFRIGIDAHVTEDAPSEMTSEWNEDVAADISAVATQGQILASETVAEMAVGTGLHFGDVPAPMVEASGTSIPLFELLN